MRCLSYGSGIDVLRGLGLSANVQHECSLNVGAWFGVGKDSGRKNAAAFALVRELGVEAETVLMFTEMGIFPSAENPHLVQRYRESFGVLEEVNDAPFHLLEKDEDVVLATLLELALFFIWGCVVIVDGGAVGIVLSHDEMIGAFGTDLERVKALEEVLVLFAQE